MIKDLFICLTNPIGILRIIGKKMINIIIIIISFSLVVMIPTILRTSFDDSIGLAASAICRDTMIGSGDDFKLEISNYELTGAHDYYFYTDDCQYFLNATGYNFQTDYYDSKVMFTFNTNSLNISYLGLTIKDLSYEELDVKDLNFRSIMLGDYEAANEFGIVIDKAYSNVRAQVVLIKCLAEFIALYIHMFILFLVLLITARITKRIIPTNVAKVFILYCLPIFEFSFLISTLFNAEWIQIVGAFLSLIFMIVSMNAIIEIKVTQTEKED